MAHRGITGMLVLGAAASLLSSCSSQKPSAEWLFPVVAPGPATGGAAVPAELISCLDGVKARIHVGGDPAVFLVGVQSSQDEATKAYDCVRQLRGYRAGTVTRSPVPN